MSVCVPPGGVKELIGEQASLRYVQLKFVIYICDSFGENLTLCADKKIQTYKSLALPLTFRMVHHSTLHSP